MLRRAAWVLALALSLHRAAPVRGEEPLAPPARVTKRDVLLRQRRLEEAIQAQPRAFHERKSLIAHVLAAAPAGASVAALARTADLLGRARAILEERPWDDVRARLERVRVDLPSAVVVSDARGAEARVRLLPLVDAPLDDLEVGVEVTWSQAGTSVARQEAGVKPFVEWRRRGLTPVFLETPGRWSVRVAFEVPFGDGEWREVGSTVGEAAVVLLETRRAFEAGHTSDRMRGMRAPPGTPPGVVPTLLRVGRRCATALQGVSDGQEAPDLEAEIGLYLADVRSLDAATAAGKAWIPNPAALPRDGVRATAGGARYRLLVPPRAEGWVPGFTSVPLVLAFHGVGGSEATFFEAHGAGEAVRQCSVRRWILASPEDPGQALEVLDDVRTFLPIDDRRIYAVSHGRGVDAFWRANLARTELFAAAAVVSSGASWPDLKEFVRIAGLPLLFVQGGQDPQAKIAGAVAARLVESGVLLERLDLPDLDPLLTVGASLPRVFRWFDTRVRK